MRRRKFRPVVFVPPARLCDIPAGMFVAAGKYHASGYPSLSSEAVAAVDMRDDRHGTTVRAGSCPGQSRPSQPPGGLAQWSV